MDPKKAFLYTVTLVMRIKFRSYENKVSCHLMHTNYTIRYENDLLYVISNCYIKMVVNQKQIHVSENKW